MIAGSSPAMTAEANAYATRSTTVTTDGAANAGVAPTPFRKPASPDSVDFRRLLLRTWEAIQARISPSMPVDRLAQDDRSVSGESATWRGGTRWPAAARAHGEIGLTDRAPQRPLSARHAPPRWISNAT